MSRVAPAALATIALAGCHLIFPFGVLTPDGGSASDAPPAEAGPHDGASEAAPDGRPPDAGADAPALETGTPDAKPDGPASPVLKHLWSRTLGGTGEDWADAVAVDGSGNVYLTGHFRGTAELGGGSLLSKGIDDIFVTGFTSAGTHRWQQDLGGGGTDVGRGVGVDGSGNVYLTGRFSGTADLGGSSVTAQGQNDIYLTSFTAAGKHRSQQALGGGGSDIGYGVAVASNGTVYLAGAFSGTANLGGGNAAAKGGSDAFVTSFSATGTHRWQQALGGSLTDTGWNVALDGSGNVYLTGAFSGTANLGGGSVASQGSSDAFVTSFTAAGVHRWQKALGGALADFGYGVATDSGGNVYLTGSFTGTASLGGGKATAKGGRDVFVTSFTAAGAHRWQKALGGASDEIGRGVGVDGSGNVYIGGYFNGTTDLGGGSVASKGNDDVFVVKLGP